MGEISSSIAVHISNIRYGSIVRGRRTVLFDFDGETQEIPEPPDAVLVSPNIGHEKRAAQWIARNYLLDLTARRPISRLSAA